MSNQKPEILRGNFTTRQTVTGEDIQDDLTTQFEREALKRLGGSIAFVSKKKFVYGMDVDADKANAPQDSQVDE